MTSRLGYKSEKTSSARRSLLVKESYNLVHYTQLSFDGQTKLFISASALIQPRLTTKLWPDELSSMYFGAGAGAVSQMQ